MKCRQANFLGFLSLALNCRHTHEALPLFFESPALTATYRRRLSRQGRGRTLGCLFFQDILQFSYLFITLKCENEPGKRDSDREKWKTKGKSENQTINSDN